MGYPYYYFSYDPDGDHQFIGSAIFSKYPMLDTGLVRYFRPSMTEALVHADIKVNDDTIRVYATHLQSCLAFLVVVSFPFKKSCHIPTSNTNVRRFFLVLKCRGRIESPENTNAFIPC